MSKELLVSKIREGTVIDHIKAGKGRKVLDFLGIDDSYPEIVILLMNVDSKKIKKKDILKLSNKFLKQDEVDKIALIAPNATGNVIKNFKVVDKMSIKIPETIEGILKCPNPKCVSNADEPLKTKFMVEKEEPVSLRCFYCERLMDLKDIIR